jgi:hypothetical protein
MLRPLCPMPIKFEDKVSDVIGSVSAERLMKMGQLLTASNAESILCAPFMYSHRCT